MATIQTLTDATFKETVGASDTQTPPKENAV